MTKMKLKDNEIRERRELSHSSVPHTTNNENDESTIDQNNSFRNDHEMLVNYIKTCKIYLDNLLDRKENNEYPKTTLNFYKVGRVRLLK